MVLENSIARAPSSTLKMSEASDNLASSLALLSPNHKYAITDGLIAAIFLSRPEEVAKLMVINKTFNFALRNNAFWERATSRFSRREHFKFKPPQADWFGVFKECYQASYKPKTPARIKKMFSAIYENDTAMLSSLNLTLTDLLAVNNAREHAVLALAHPNVLQSTRNNIYKKIIKPTLAPNGYQRDFADQCELLHWAVCLNLVNLLNDFLKSPDITRQINQVSHDRCTPLQTAAMLGYTDITATLIKAGARIETISRKYRVTALYHAAYSAHPDIVDLLINAKAQLEIHAPLTKNTPLIAASALGHTEVIETLLKAGANVKSRSSKGLTALHRAAYFGHITIMKALFRYQADIDARSIKGNTPLHSAANGNQLETLQLLIEHKADLNVQENKHHHTPFFLAVYKNKLSVVEALLLAGADMTIPNKEGVSPLNWALTKYANVFLKPQEKQIRLSIIKAMLRTQLDQFIIEMTNALNAPTASYTLFGLTLFSGDSNQAKLNAAVALRNVDQGTADADILKEHQAVIRHHTVLSEFYKKISLNTSPSAKTKLSH